MFVLHADTGAAACRNGACSVFLYTACPFCFLPESSSLLTVRMLMFVLVADFGIAASGNGPCSGGSVSAQLPWPEQADHWRAAGGV